MRYLSVVITVVVLFFTLELFPQLPPNWIWAKTTRKNASINAITTDNLGNCYAAGAFGPDSIVFNNTNLYVDFGGTSDFFLVKYDPNGNVIWARQSFITASCRAIAIATDQSNNIYMIGDYQGGMNIDTVNLSSFPNNNTDNVFLVKFNSNGGVMWGKRIGGDYYTNSYALAVDNNGNVFVTGKFIGSYVKFGTITLQNPDQVNKTSSTFLSKYDTNGNILWAKNTTGNSVGTNGCWPAALATDQLGNIYLTGQFNTPTVGFGSSVSLTKTGVTDVFLTKYNSSGTTLWAKKPIGNYVQWSTSLSTNFNNDVILTGYFESDTLKFGSTILTNTQTTIPNENLFIAKFSSLGNVIWAKSKGRTKTTSMGVDNLGNNYLLGSYRDSVIFGNTKLKYNNMYGNIFLAKYDINGNDLWARDVSITKALTGNNFVMPYAINQKINNDIYIGGAFDCKRVKLDSCTLQNWDTTGQSHSIILAKINSTYVGINENKKLNSEIEIFPNPFTDEIKIKLKEINNLPLKTALTISSVSGIEIEKITFSGFEQKIDLFKLKSGVYILKLHLDHENDFYFKIIKN